MKVLVLAPGLSSLGGIQRYVLTLKRALEDLFGGSQIRIVSLELPDQAARNSAAAILRAKAKFVLGALNQGIVWRPDLVICAHVGFSPLGRVLRTLRVAPYWVMAYGIDVWGHLPKADHDALLAADRVITISTFTGKQLAELQGVSPERILLLPPCLDEEWLADATSSASVERRADHRPTLLTVSRLSSSERYKGHDEILKALPQVLEQFPRALYVIAGDGDDRPRLEELTRSLRLEDSVHFAGAVSVAALKDCYRECDLFVMPARTVIDKSAPKGEGFGIVFLEAMVNRKPVIGPATGAPSEFIHHCEHGLLIDPENPAELASAIIQLLSAPERSKEMGDAGREWVLQQYSFERFTERLRDLFLETNIVGHTRQAQCAS